MTVQNRLFLIPLLAVYLTVLAFTEFSLTGYWTDIIVVAALSFSARKAARRHKADGHALGSTLKAVGILCSILIFGMVSFTLINPFAWLDSFKLRSFYFQSVQGRLFNAYFKPVGAYAGGYGNFWITESSILFPLVERRVYFDRTVDHDFTDDTWEGMPVNNYAVVKEYILKEVITKSNKRKWD
jgi:hypothetical protein